MSLHTGLLMINTDVRDNLSDIFSRFDYVPVGSTKVNSFERAGQEMSYPRPDKPRNLVHKAVAIIEGWTVIIDPEMAMALEKELCTELSTELGVKIFSMICEGASGTYSFMLTENGEQRVFLSIEGEIHESKGSPIPEEEGINLETLFQDDVLLIMDKLGVDYSRIETCPEFDVWELDEGQIEIPREYLDNTSKNEKKKKAWWKFW